jgi:PAS domain S-box-containing protein
MNQEQLLQRILLIDNRQDDRALIIQALTRELPGIQVKEILNFDGLNQAIATLDFDLAIVHDPLSWTTGLDLVRRLKQASNCPIIMFTDSGDLNVAVAAMKAGLDDYVVQSPEDTAPLIQAVRSVLQNVQTQRDRLGTSPNQPELLYGIPFNDSPNPMWIYDPETLRFLAVNQAAIDHYGYSETEFLSMTIAQNHPPEDVPSLLKKVADNQSISRSGEGRHRKRDGTLIDVEMTSHQITWQNRPVRLVMVNDITDRKAAENRLRQQAEREYLIRTVTEHIRQSLNLDEILTRTVTEVRQMLRADRVLIYQLEPDGSGYVVQESVAADWPAILGRKLFDPCFSVGYIEQYFQGRIQALADIDDGSIEACHADFLRQLDVRANLVVPILQTNYLWGLLIVQQCSQPRSWLVEETHLLQQLADQVSIALQQAQLYQQLQAELAERQRAEAALRASETRFRKLAANVPGVICQYVLHPDGSDEFLYMSPGSQSLWEIDAAEIERDISLIWNLVHPDDELAMQASILASAQSLQPWLWEWRIITPSGLLKWVRATAQPELQPNGDIIWDGLVMDISDRKTAELLLQQQAQQAQALNRVVQSIRNSLDLPTIFATATAEMTQLLGVYQTAIVQYFPERSCWRVVACHRFDESLPDTTGFEVPDEINPYATQLKQFQIVRSDGIDQINDPVNQEIFKRFPFIWLIVPIILNNTIWGSLSLSKPQDKGSWNDEEVELACKVADQLAIAIQQAQLYQQAQQELSQRQQAEAALQQLNQELEQRVQERTEQLQQEAHIRRQAEAKFQQIFHISPHAIAIASLQDRQIIEINEAFCQLFGYSCEEMMGHNADEFTLFANPADQGLVQRRLMELGSVRNLECVIRTKTGEARTAIASAEFIDIDRIPCFLISGNDITDRKQAEEALLQSEARFQKIAAASPAQIYILVTHLDGSLIRFEYVSPAVWELREVSPEQLLQNPAPIYDQIHPDDRAAYFAARNHSLATMEPFFHEYRIIPPSGQVKWVRVNSRPERRDNDEIVWYGIVLDVSDRKQAEAALKQSERWLQNFSLQIVTMVYTFVQDSNGLSWFEYLSPTSEVLLEIPVEQAMRDSSLILNLVHPDDRPARLVAISRSQQTLEPYQAEYRMVMPSGTLKWMQVYAQIESRGDGAFAWYGVLIDISDRKRLEDERKHAEEALRQSEERWQLAIQGSNEGIWDWNIQTNKAFRSDRFYEILGFSKQDLGGDEQSWSGCIHPDDVEQVMATKQDYLSRKIPAFAMEYRMRCQDNTYKWVLDRAIAVWDEQGNPVRMVGSLGDISDRKQIEKQLRASLKEKEVLLREVYHRVKNNMQLVSSLLNLQANSINDPTVLRLLNESQQRVKTMALIHERLYRSKNLARINVATYIQDVVNNLVRSYTTARSSIRVTLELADVELDLDRAVPCGLIINELVSNAFKYAFPEQKGELYLRFGLEDTGNYCLIVKDDGIGIPGDIAIQYTDSLGMQLIYGLTEQLGGQIELNRQEGSQFRITFRKMP